MNAHVKKIDNETDYLLSCKANIDALRDGMKDSHSSHKLTPDEWDKLIKSKK